MKGENFNSPPPPPSLRLKDTYIHTRMALLIRIRKLEFVKRYDKRERERGRFLDDGIHVGKKNGDGRLWECMYVG